MRAKTCPRLLRPPAAYSLSIQPYLSSRRCPAQVQLMYVAGKEHACSVKCTKERAHHSRAISRDVPSCIVGGLADVVDVSASLQLLSAP